jgi:hypothetical protein
MRRSALIVAVLLLIVGIGQLPAQNPTDPKKPENKGLETNFFSGLEARGLKVTAFSLERDKDAEAKQPGNRKMYRVSFLVQFDKDITGDDLEQAKALFGSFPPRTTPYRPRYHLYVGVYFFRSKDNIVGRVSGKPRTIEGEMTGKKNDAFRVTLEPVSFTVGSGKEAREISIDDVKSMVAVLIRDC